MTKGNTMTDQPTNGPTKPPGGGSPPTEPMKAVESATPAAPPATTTPATPTQAAPTQALPTPAEAPKRNLWHRATSTHGGRWGVAIGAGVLACLLLFGIAVAALSVVGRHDRVNLAGERREGIFGGQSAPGNGQGPGEKMKNHKQGAGMPGNPGTPGMQGGRMARPGGLGALAGEALHGDVSASANGSVQELVFQRGEVTAVSATSITIKSSDGFTGTYGITSATTSRGAAPVMGGQAFVLAKASDKVAIELKASPVKAAAEPSTAPSS